MIAFVVALTFVISVIGAVFAVWVWRDATPPALWEDDE